MEAWADLKHVNVLMLWRDPLIRAALLRQLGRSAEAQGTAAELQRLKPDSVSRPVRLLRRLVQTEDHSARRTARNGCGEVLVGFVIPGILARHDLLQLLDLVRK